MSDLPANPPPSQNLDASTTSPENAPLAESQEPQMHGPVRTDTRTAIAQSMNPPPPPSSGSAAEPEQKIARQFSTAIGPSADDVSPTVPAKDSEAPSATTGATGPALTVTLLLTSGARHPFKLDSKYFAKRSVDVPDNDPFHLSVYKLKELILREWREEWEAKPSSPTSIRLINMGKLLDDKASLKGRPNCSMKTDSAHSDLFECGVLSSEFYANARLSRLQVCPRFTERTAHDD
jgi:hypothetical protein